MTDAPAINEMLWSTQENTPVYYDPKITAERVRSNYEGDQSFHDFRKGDQVGTLIDDGVIRDDAGNEFYGILFEHGRTASPVDVRSFAHSKLL